MRVHRKNIYVATDSIISALGTSTAENMEAILQYKSGIGKIDNPDIYTSVFPVARINTRKSIPTIENGLLYTDLECLFINSIQTVLQAAGLSLHDPECGLIIATTKGNIDNINEPEAYLGKMADRVAAYFHAVHTPLIVSNACISGVSALLVASRLLESGKYKHMVVAGGDLLTRFVVSGFQSFKSVSDEACKPYDALRDGLTLGEACGAVVLTTERAVVKDFPAVLIEGGGITNDANHISGPSRTGDGLFYAIQLAMEEAGVGNSDISFINAHGTATLYNDEMEAKALNWAGLSEVPVNSLKGYWGHTLGAAGLIESIACFEQLRRGIVWGTKGYHTSGVSLPLSISPLHREVSMKCCLKTASGFGGCNVAAIYTLEKYVKEKESQTLMGERIVRHCQILKGEVKIDGAQMMSSSAPFGDFIRMAFKALNQPNMKFFKMDDLSKLGFTAVSWLLNDWEINGLETGIVLANAAASLDTDRKHQEIIDRLGDTAASPAVFVYTLPNVMMGEICIKNKIQGENTFFIQEHKTLDFLQEYATLLMEKHKLKACIYGWCELDGEKYEADLYLLTL